MDLGTLLDRLEYERGGEHEHEEVLLLAPGGRHYEVLSLNWEKGHGHWVIIGEHRRARREEHSGTSSS